MRGDDGDLEADAQPQTGNDLIADPFSGGGADVEGEDQAGADGSDDAGADHEGDEVALGGDVAARCDGAERHSDDHGEVADAGFLCADAGYDLEVDGEIVEQDEEGAAEGEDEHHPDVVDALFDQAERHDSTLTVVPL